MKKYILITFLTILSLSAKDSLQLTKDYKEFNKANLNWSMIDDLPDKRKSELIKKIMLDKNGQTQYIACGFLIRSGKEDQTIETLAGLIATGKDQTDLKGRMGYDWAHSDDEKMGGRIILKICQHLNNNYKKYPKNEQAKILTFFKNFGLTGNYTKDKVNKLISQLKTKMN